MLRIIKYIPKILLANKKILIMKQKIWPLLSVQLHSQSYFSKTQVRLLPVSFRISHIYQLHNYQCYQWIISILFCHINKWTHQIAIIKWTGRQPTIVISEQGVSPPLLPRGPRPGFPVGLAGVHLFKWSYQWHELNNLGSTFR